jgi:hypothetical protein
VTLAFGWDHPVPGGYKYWDLALQVGRVSDEAVIHRILRDCNQYMITLQERAPYMKKKYIVVFCVRFFCFYIVSSETASRPNERSMRAYHWISLFMPYIKSTTN